MPGLYELLPLIIRIRDRFSLPDADAGEGVIERICWALDQETDAISQDIAGLLVLLDPDNCDSQYLLYLSMALGMPLGSTLDENFRRWLTKNLVNLWKIKSTHPSWNLTWRWTLDREIRAHELFKNEIYAEDDYSRYPTYGWNLKAARVELFEILPDGSTNWIPLSQARGIYEYVERLRPAHVLLRQYAEKIYLADTAGVVSDTGTSILSTGTFIDDVPHITDDVEFTATCLATCESACQEYCQTTCEESACEVVCETGCEVACEILCEIQCQEACEVVCQAGCIYACENSCQAFTCQFGSAQGAGGPCVDACELDCEFDCEQGCEAFVCETQGQEGGCANCECWGDADANEFGGDQSDYWIARGRTNHDVVANCGIAANEVWIGHIGPCENQDQLNQGVEQGGGSSEFVWDVIYDDCGHVKSVYLADVCTFVVESIQGDHTWLDEDVTVGDVTVSHIGPCETGAETENAVGNPLLPRYIYYFRYDSKGHIISDSVDSFDGCTVFCEIGEESTECGVKSLADDGTWIGVDGATGDPVTISHAYGGSTYFDVGCSLTNTELITWIGFDDMGHYKDWTVRDGCNVYCVVGQAQGGP